MLFLPIMNEITNPRLEFFRSKIGESMNDSPSPLGKWLNGRIKAADYGRLVADFEVREEMTNPAGVLHGGAASAILDDLIGAMVYSLGREYAYTSINLTVDFLHAARLGDIVTATAALIRAGKNIIHCEGQIVAVSGKIIAKCATNLIQTSIRVGINE